MSLHSTHHVLPQLSNWHAAKDNDRYVFGKPFVDGQSLTSLKIYDVTIYVFKGVGNHRLEVLAKTFDFPTYLKIVEVAQNKFADKSLYYFDSTYRRFPKDRDGNCSVKVVQIEQQLNPLHFQNTHLEAPLAYRCRYDSKEDLSNQLTLALGILQEADSSVEDILSNLEAILKV